MADDNHAEADDGFTDSFTIPLFKEIDSKEQRVQGGFKTQEAPYRLDNGSLVYQSDKETSYTASVERLLAVDGWEDETKTKPMTLLVFEYEIKTTDTSGRFESVKTWLILEDFESTPEKDRATPDVQAWGPFEKTEIWNESKDPVTTESNIGGEIGANVYGAAAKVNAANKKTRASEERFFDKGSTTKKFSLIDDRRNGIVWYLSQNRSTNEGVAHKFTLAILFSRKQDTAFEITFGLRCKAGLLHAMKGWFGFGHDFDRKSHIPRSRTRHDGDTKMVKRCAIW